MTDDMSELIERMRRREMARKSVRRSRLAERMDEEAEYTRCVAIEKVVSLYLSRDCDPSVLKTYLSEDPINFSDLARRLPESVPCDGCYDITQTSNPYLKAFLNVPELPSAYLLYVREVLAQVFAFAIPSEQALSTIAAYGPVLEVGAGTGYWAALLKARGVDVIAVDIQPVESRDVSVLYKRSFTTVLQADERVVRQYPERTLLLSWPPDRNPMPFAALDSYRGKHVIFIGESEFGCTADAPFHRLLEREWQLIDSVDIPRWNEANDWLQVYEGKSRSN
jgi:SAM-dependent methyltransferase